MLIIFSKALLELVVVLFNLIAVFYIPRNTHCGLNVGSILEMIKKPVLLNIPII